MNKYTAWLLCGIVSFSLGCSDGGPAKGSGDSFKAILITDVGGLGDKGFNDSGWAGCQLAKKRLEERGESIDVQFIEAEEQTDYVPNLNMAAERADVVITMGFLIADAVEKVAAHNPNRHFIFVDGVVKGDNVASVVFRSQEGGFVAGILSSYVTQSGVLGVVPGMDIPPVLAFASGFRAGALTGGALQGKGITPLSTTVGSFTDPVKAKSIANGLMDQNADIILQLAGNSGLGVIEAVKDAPGGVFAIGADIDQDDLAPGKVLTSILKRIDLVVADLIVQAFDGEFKGGHVDVGLKEDAVGLTDMRNTKQFVPKEAFAAIEKVKQHIVDGTVSVPNTYDGLESFDPNKTAELLK